MCFPHDIEARQEFNPELKYYRCAAITERHEKKKTILNASNDLLIQEIDIEQLNKASISTNLYSPFTNLNEVPPARKRSVKIQREKCYRFITRLRRTQSFDIFEAPFYTNFIMFTSSPYQSNVGDSPSARSKPSPTLLSLICFIDLLC